MSRLQLITIGVVVAVLFFMVMNQTTNQISTITLSKKETIVAFGDSITYGYGVAPTESYPAQLQNLLGVEVVNAGISGEESAEGLARLSSVLETKPKVVILCHGGNDILRQRSTLNLQKNLLAMIQLIQASGAEVLLVGVPNFGMIGFKPHPLYKEIAQQTNVLFEEDALSFVEADNSLKIDAIHPNKKGYEIMAKAFAKYIEVKEN